MRILTFICLLAATTASVFAQQSAASLRGQITDPLGAVIVGASVVLVGNNSEKTAQTDGEGRFVFSNLAAGLYVVGVSSPGFAPFEERGVEIASNSRREMNVQLNIIVNKQEVTVGEENRLSTESQNNAGALVLRETDLETLPESPEELEAALRSLAGVPVGPDGGQILIDGFTNTGQPLPDRNSIREIRINENPFSAENDRVGFGQIQIITRPGGEQWHGALSFNFSDESLNSRNPFAPSRAAYQSRFYGGTLSGPIIKKRASFFFAFNEREWDDNEFVNATVLDSSLNAVQFRQTIVAPRRTTSFTASVDYQINPNNTLTVRYNPIRSIRESLGVGGFSLPDRAYTARNRIDNIQLTETAVINEKYVNEFRLQLIDEDQTDEDANPQPTVNVLGAFITGGAGIGLSRNPESRLTVQDSVLWTAGKHTLRVGARLRRTAITDVSPDNFNGSFTFGGGLAPRLDATGEIVRDLNGQIVFETITSLERYRRTLFFQQHRLSPSEIRTRGGGATQFARGGGNPLATAEQIDFGAYVQDDWRVTPTLTLALGLRYEVQANINQNLNLAPRVSFAWVPRFADKDVRKPTTVVRGGFGIFFDRFNENQVLISNKFAGGDYFQFITTDPQFTDAFPLAPSLEQLRQAFGDRRTVWRIADDLREPYMTQAALSLERQLPLKTTVSATFIAARTFHALRTRNINSPVIARDAAGEIVTGARPLSDRGDILQYESNGRFNQTQLVLTVNNRLSNRISFFANYTLNRAKSDTDGVGTFPSDNYDLSTEYGRSSSDVRHTFSASGTFDLPFKIRLNPLVFASSGRPFNITTGRDANRDSFFTDRPAFATDLTKPGVIVTEFGAFDPNPLHGQQIIPRNYGTSPGFFSVNLNASRVFKFGQAKTTNGKAGEKPYNLTISARAVNLFNRAKFAGPVGNLSSPFFGQSVSTAGGFGAASVGNPAAGNRRVELQIRFSF